MGTLRHFLVGMAATVLLVAAKISFESTVFGHGLEVKTFEALQNALPDWSGARLPIVVVDIRNLPGGKDGPTSRQQLKALLTAIVAQGPKAVAVDIDFSPNAAGWITPRDPEFFDFCLALKKQRQTPIFLGVFRTRAEGPDVWLGSPKYQELAAAGFVKGDDTWRLARWIRSADGTSFLPTIGEALAKVYGTTPPPPPEWLAGLLERPQSETLENSSAASNDNADVLVNYSKLEQFKSEHLPFINPATAQEVGSLLQGKLVLLGDVSMAADTFIVPGQSAPVPGVYLMASVAYTVAAEPLYEFTHQVRLSLDFAISLFLVIGILRIGKRTETIEAKRKRSARFLYITVGSVIILGLLLVRFTHIMWFDFFLAPAAMLLHPKVEKWLSTKLLRGKRGRHA